MAIEEWKINFKLDVESSRRNPWNDINMTHSIHS
jgi:hypothetical protein